MKIGSIDLGTNPVVLAPMEDVTDQAFRLMCRKFGSALVYTEFVSADAIVRSIRSTLSKMTVSDEERPVAIQIYGKEPEVMAEAAQITEAAGPDIIDINFGCPVKRVAGKGAGAGLLLDVPRMLAITRAVADAVQLPVTVKTRLGWDADHIIIEELAEQLQDAGAQALTIHGRTRKQMYKGSADWAPIARVKANPRLNIPIIANGDITDGDSALRCYEQTRADAIMIGRGAIGRPWVFEEVSAVLQGKEPPRHDHEWYLDVLKQQVDDSIARSGEQRGIWHIRRHLAATPLLKGIPDFRQQRVAILRAETREKLFELLDSVPPTSEKV